MHGLRDAARGRRGRARRRRLPARPARYGHRRRGRSCRVTTLALDDYVAFCEGIRNLVGIDLLQYKRGQMERRIRTFASRQGVDELAAYLRLLRSDRAQLERFLDRVTINV